MPESLNEHFCLMREQFGFFGGTFDPVHLGHMEMARFVYNKLSLDRMWLVPAASPPHRDPPVANAIQRLEMLRIGTKSFPELEIEPLELDRTGASYTVTTLIDLRNRFGAEASLYWCMGIDAFNGLTTWYQWRSLFELAHLIVVTRPGYSETVSPILARELRQRQVADLKQLAQSPFGSIGVLESPPHKVSATELREALSQTNGNAPDKAAKWLPTGVLNYIQQNRLYQ